MQTSDNFFILYILNSDCNTTKYEKSKGLWIFSEGIVDVLEGGSASQWCTGPSSPPGGPCSQQFPDQALDGTAVASGEDPGWHTTFLQPLHPLNWCGGVIGPCNVLGYVDTGGFTTADSLCCSPIDVNRGIFPPLLPEVNNQLLCFADVEGDVVVLAPQLQFTFRLTRRCWLSGLQPWCCQQTWWWSWGRAKPCSCGWTGSTAEGWGHIPGWPLC